MKDLLLCVHLNFGNFTLSFFRLRQRIVLKCVLHVQHDYFSSFNQSDRLFSGVVVAVAPRPCLSSLLFNLPKMTILLNTQTLQTKNLHFFRLVWRTSWRICFSEFGLTKPWIELFLCEKKQQQKQQQKNKNKSNNNNRLLIGVVDSLIHEAAISANYTSFYNLKCFFFMFFVSILDDTRKRLEK